jgi:hypothetical protein
VAALSRRERLPKLETLLSKRGDRQSADQQRGMLRILSEQYGIPLQRRTVN